MLLDKHGFPKLVSGFKNRKIKFLNLKFFKKLGKVDPRASEGSCQVLDMPLPPKPAFIGRFRVRKAPQGRI